MEEEEYTPMKPLSAPRMAEGNIIIEIDEEEYHRGVEELKYNTTGKLALSRAAKAPTTMEMKIKLMEYWKINDLKVIPLGRGPFHILLSNLKDQCIALSVGAILFNPGVLTLNSWMPG